MTSTAASVKPSVPSSRAIRRLQRGLVCPRDGGTFLTTTLTLNQWPVVQCEICQSLRLAPSHHDSTPWPDGLPAQCKLEHYMCWEIVFRFGRADATCEGVRAIQRPKQSAGLRPKGMDPEMETLYRVCGQQASARGKPQGFIANPGESRPANITKAIVLLALEGQGEIGMGHLVALAQASYPMSHEQVAGAVQRGLAAQVISRSATKVWLPPNTFGYTYAITMRGKAWLQWASRIGIVTTKSASQ